MKNSNTQEQTVIKRARNEIEKKTGKALEQLYAERKKRLMDAVQLKTPDRVPIFIKFGHFPLRYAGLPQSALFYDPGAYQEALISCLVEFEPDSFSGNPHNTSGSALEKLGPTQFAWPGGSLRPEQADQFYDIETMKEDEYDLIHQRPGCLHPEAIFASGLRSDGPACQSPPLPIFGAIF